MRGNVRHMQSIYTFLTILILFQYLVLKLVADWISGIRKKWVLRQVGTKLFFISLPNIWQKKFKENLVQLAL